MTAVSSVAKAPPGNAVDGPVKTYSQRNQRRKRVYLSHSARELFTTCGRKYRYSYVDRLETVELSANLGFGKAFHRGAEVYLINITTGEVVADPIAEFDREWDEFCSNHIVDYSSRWDREGLREVGHRLLQIFMEDWIARGLLVVLDAQGQPVLERKLKIELPDDVIYTAVIDVLAMTPEGLVLVIDLKTPAQAAFHGFVELAEQLLGYQVVIDAHAEALAIEQVDGRAFYELIKVPIPKTSRGTGPKVAPLEVAGRADEDAIRDWMYETIAIANDIRNGRFPKRPGDAYASPCSMCAFSKKCISNSMEGLRIKDPYTPNAVKRVPVSADSSSTIPF